MLGKVPPTTSSLNLVNPEGSDADDHDGITMADLVESLDTRELEMGEAEDNDYDGNLGVCVCVCVFPVCLESCRPTIKQHLKGNITTTQGSMIPDDA